MSRSNVRDPGRVIAHRGASLHAPENTIQAFELAISQGARWIEFDVSLLGDGTPVVAHDGTLDRCTDRSGSLTDICLADLPGIDARNGRNRYAGAQIPTLDAVLDLVLARGIYANLEIKAHGRDPSEIAQIVADALEQRPWTQQRIIVSSFDQPALVAIRRRDARMPLAVLHKNPPADWRNFLNELNAAAMHIHYAHVSQSLLREATAHGFDVRVYTINEPEPMLPFREHGLTSVITDHPPVFLEDPRWSAWVAS